MATSRASHLKEKVTAPSSSPSTTVGRKSPRPPGSPNRQLSTTPDKPTTHNYLRSKSSISAPKSTAPKSTINAKSTVKKSTDVKPPSPIRRPERTLSAPKPRSPSPLPRPSRSGNSHALDRKGARALTKSSSTISGRTTKNNPPITRSKSLEKRKEIVATPSAFVDNSASNLEALGNKDEVEVMEEADHNHDVAAQESNNVEEHEAKKADILVIEHENENEHELANDEAVAEDNKQDEAMESVVDEDSPKKPDPEPETEEHVQNTEAPTTATARGVVAPKKEALKSNDVIEEAKSKFLEKRKNKVLALVGAFETVMALQEPDGQQTQQPKKDKEVDEGNSNANESTEST